LNPVQRNFLKIAIVGLLATISFSNKAIACGGYCDLAALQYTGGSSLTNLGVDVYTGLNSAYVDVDISIDIQITPNISWMNYFAGLLPPGYGGYQGYGCHSGCGAGGGYQQPYNPYTPYLPTYTPYYPPPYTPTSYRCDNIFIMCPGGPIRYEPPMVVAPPTTPTVGNPIQVPPITTFTPTLPPQQPNFGPTGVDPNRGQVPRGAVHTVR